MQRAEVIQIMAMCKKFTGLFKRKFDIYQSAERMYFNDNAINPVFNSTHEGYALIKHRVDDLWITIKKAGPSEIGISEKYSLAQIMAMCIKFLESWPEEK